MGLALTDDTIEKYLRFLTKLDDLTKKRLITKLTESIKVKEKAEFNLSSLYGAWKDSKSSDEIIEEIRKSRIEKKDSIDL